MLQQPVPNLECSGRRGVAGRETSYGRAVSGIDLSCLRMTPFLHRASIPTFQWSGDLVETVIEFIESQYRYQFDATRNRRIATYPMIAGTVYCCRGLL